MTSIRYVAVLFVLTLLGACGDRPQALGFKGDESASAGTVNTSFKASDWKAGDKASWEQALRARAQNQNDYVKTP
ncbi:MAG: hypothetical protein EXR35_04900 [Limnohabitans sp.]|nr:hypothetical protein [Limnohabitans sp.]